MNESGLETVARRLSENGDDFSCMQMQMNPGYEARDVNLLTEAVLANHTLQTIDFFGILSEDDVNEAVRRFVGSFGTLPNLKSLKVSGYCMDLMATLGRVLQQVASLKSLTIQYVQLQGDFPAFNEALRQHSGLESLEIIDCQQHTDTDILASILDSLGDKGSLKELVLSPINPVALGNIPVEALIRICRLPNLEKLHIYGFEGPLVAPQVEQILKALMDNGSIQHLRFPAVLDRRNCEALVDFIRTTTGLKSLRVELSHKPERSWEWAPNDILTSSKLLLEIGDALPHNSSLQELMLVPLGLLVFSPKSIEVFGKKLETNYSLQNVMPASRNGSLYTRLNQQGRKELIQKADATREDWVAKIIEVREDLECIFYFLSTNPLLCDLEDP